MAIIGQDIAKAAKILEEGGLVGLPTETVYGLAANALNIEAVTAIFETKQRPSFDPLIIHTDSIAKVKTYTRSMDPRLLRLAERFWPGPLTLLLPRGEMISDLVTSGLDTVAVRIPNHPLALSLLKRLDFPLAAPSANPFGYISPTTAAHVEAQLGDKIPYILDGGPSDIGIESTIIGIEGDKLIVYRLGGMSLEMLSAVAGHLHVNAHSSSNPKSPGMLKSHYAPRKPFYLGELSNLMKVHQGKKIGILAFDQLLADCPASFQEVLSPSGDLSEAAQHLFSAMRRLDTLDVDLIIASTVPDRGLGLAINDRLRRAAATE
ncbi:L-threonylcarbamoyladenylate synthase [Penaeicola halotolerans]|uniref:L-threonylcarbamoyladenylate synthase n=1 Tax=Penaeicola halotolerans TaxID=2793196 RepID=UPI001CF8EE15|nr:L-threonylcarbamoyladenylate synthase [Penaeicola halotolerans]